MPKCRYISTVNRMSASDSYEHGQYLTRIGSGRTWKDFGTNSSRIRDELVPNISPGRRDKRDNPRGIIGIIGRSTQNYQQIHQTFTKIHQKSTPNPSKLWFSWGVCAPPDPPQNGPSAQDELGTKSSKNRAVRHGGRAPLAETSRVVVFSSWKRAPWGDKS